jgi:hypothetical protein
MSEQTPALVADTATRADVLSLRSLTVIGLMRTQEGHVALLRSARGRIARVQAGVEVFGVRVAAISDTQVLLTDRSGQTHALVVAGG